MKKWRLIQLFLIVFFGWFLTWRLGWASLRSFDEAWYGSIARDLIGRPQPFLLFYNGQPFIDHPPLVIWLMAFSYKLLGVSEFSTRIVSALTGVGAIVLMTSIGQKLFSRRAGLMAGTMLGSSLWFVLRARSGNLDVPFVFFGLLSVWLALGVADLRDTGRRLRITATIGSLALVLLSKTLVGLSIVVPVVLILWWSRSGLERSSGLEQAGWSGSKKSDLKSWLVGAGLLLLILGPWYVINFVQVAGFGQQHFWKIGLRERSQLELGMAVIQQNLSYLQAGIGRWLKPALVAMVTGFGWILWELAQRRTKKISRFARSVLILEIWLFAVVAPFFTSSQTAVWHLIPVYPPLFLLTAGMLDKIVISAGKQVLGVVLVIGVLLVAGTQLQQMSNLVIPADNTRGQVSSEAGISQLASGFEGELHLKEVFLPEAVFYSGRVVDGLGFRENAYQEMAEWLTSEEKNRHLFILKKTELNQLEMDGVAYKILAQNDQYVVITGLGVNE